MVGRRFRPKESVIINRSEFDDRFLIYDPRSGKMFFTNEIGVLIWYLLRCYEVDRIVEAVSILTGEKMETINKDLNNFLERLKKLGLVEIE